MEITNEYHKSVTPLVVFFILCNIVGFSGNSVVLYIYSLRYPKNRHRLIVLVLSAVDMTACCSTVPIETVSTWYWFDVPSSSLCKARFFFIMFVGLAAMYMLFVTAIYKFQQICKGKQVTQNMIIILCFVGVVISFMFGIPPLILFDVNKHNVTLNNVTETVLICEVHPSYHGTRYPAVYRHCVALYSLLLVTAVILFSFVAKTTIQHIIQMKNKRKLGAIASVYVRQRRIVNTDLVSTDGSFQSCPDPISSVDTKLGSTDGSFPSCPDPISYVDTKTSTVGMAPASISESHPPKSPKEMSATQIRKILIMIIVAGTFTITFLMGLGFGYFFALRKHEDYSSINELVILFACYRLYFLNYCLNPVVYFVLDRRFKKEIYKMLDEIIRLNLSCRV